MYRHAAAVLAVFACAGVASAGVLFPPVKERNRKAPEYYHLSPHKAALLNALRGRAWPAPDVRYKEVRDVDQWFSRGELRSSHGGAGAELYFDNRDMGQKMEDLQELNLHESQRDKADVKDMGVAPTTQPVDGQKGTIIIKPWRPRKAERV